MSEPLYPNQPLVEVATEVRFKGDLAIERIRPDFHEMIRDEYPKLLVPAAQSGIAPPLQPYRFERDDGATGIQLAINSFSYYSRKYPGHPSFLADIDRVMNRLFELHNTFEVTRLGWRYINAIPFTREDESIPLTLFFKDNPYFGNALSQNTQDLGYKKLMPINGKLANIGLESAESTQMPGIETILLDIDAFQKFEPSNEMDFSAVFNDINNLHGIGYEIFETIISDSYRAFLKGDDDE